MTAIGCLRYSKFCWVGKHINIVMKPSNSPTQGHNPTQEKIGQKVAFGPLFPTAYNFSWVGIGFIQETDYKKPNPTKFSANTLITSRVGQPMNSRPAALVTHHSEPKRKNSLCINIEYKRSFYLGTLLELQSYHMGL